MLFVIYCLDKPDQLELRMQNREDHLAYAKATKSIKFAGPMLEGDGETMIGSLIVLEAESLAGAQAWSENDPYRKAGVFQSVEVRPWKWLLGSG